MAMRIRSTQAHTRRDAMRFHWILLLLLILLLSCMCVCCTSDNKGIVTGVISGNVFPSATHYSFTTVSPLPSERQPIFGNYYFLIIPRPIKMCRYFFFFVFLNLLHKERDEKPSRNYSCIYCGAN